MSRLGLPDLGLGVGLRGQHAREILRTRPALGFLELLTENHLDVDPRRAEITDELAAAYPIFLHGVSLNLGSVDPIDRAYLRKVAVLAELTRAPLVSDHLCWTGVDGQNGHDLLPAALHRVGAAPRRRARGSRSGPARPPHRRSRTRPPYLSFCSSSMSEPEFLARLCEQADCALLLDVNNVYVSAENPALRRHGVSRGSARGAASCRSISPGHSRVRGRLIDTHAAPVSAPVWDLFALAVERFGLVSTMVEWDELSAVRGARCRGPEGGARSRGACGADRTCGVAPGRLARLQRGFLALVTARGARVAAGARAARSRSNRPARASRSPCTGTCTRCAWRARWRAEFPATRALLGEAEFGRVARAYVAAHASRSFTLEG